MNQINCHVSACAYNRDRRCDAPEIEVGSCKAGQNVCRPNETECQTFTGRSGNSGNL